ncbi:unnamed protein product [Ostreobium quekettii]|uniref:Protein kinase domain-containing protein n=1 Tax=Ostreobium quekettii TaxID=121088 RepID=A0A8S1ISD4_9CHLO|nr:unnamed protein product [Ostreobium quekettii]|eukprot:evm.model.scf_541.2 EVM.evm.TU.scf_541.2   scf_541:25010-25951(-)
MDRREEPLAGHPRYKRLKDLSSGGFAFVQLALDRDTGEKVAIKFLLRGPNINKNVWREVFNHRPLLHHHVILFKRVFLTTRYLGIVLEYAPGGDLLTFVQRRGMSEEVARWFFQQLIIGLDYLHRMGVASRDIKPENALLDDREWPLLKICDLGWSIGDEDSPARSSVGTRPYYAPEVVCAARGGPYDAKRADIWSCGVFLYVLLVGAYPFEGAGDPEDSSPNVLTRIVDVDYAVPKGAMSAQAEGLVAMLLRKDPEERPSIREIQAHPWYRVGLPRGATEMNDALVMRMDSDMQPEADILDILAEAVRLPDE